MAKAKENKPFEAVMAPVVEFNKLVVKNAEAAFNLQIQTTPIKDFFHQHTLHSNMSIVLFYSSFVFLRKAHINFSILIYIGFVIY